MVVRPDLIVICHEPEGDWVSRAPEMIVEVVSTNSARRDESIKFGLYEAEGKRKRGQIYFPAENRSVPFWGGEKDRKEGDCRDEFRLRRPFFAPKTAC